MPLPSRGPKPGGFPPRRRRIITRHDGTIVARANPEGPGSVFEFTLPAYEG